MANGQTPEGTNAPTYRPAPQGYAPTDDPTPELLQGDEPQQQSVPGTEPPAPDAADTELQELRELRDKVGPLKDYLDQGYTGSQIQGVLNQANQILEERKTATPAPPTDEWGEQPAQTDTTVQQLLDRIAALERGQGQMVHSSGMQKMEQLATQFYEKEWPDLTAEDRQKIDAGIARDFKGYSETPAGRDFLRNPTYIGVRSLALAHLDKDAMRRAVARESDRQRGVRSQMRTDEPSGSTGQESDNLGLDCATAWQRAGDVLSRGGR